MEKHVDFVLSIEVYYRRTFMEKNYQVHNKRNNWKMLTVFTDMISTMSLNKPCETHSLNLTRGRHPKLLPSISDISSRTPDSVKCSPSPTLMLNRTLLFKVKVWSFFLMLKTDIFLNYSFLPAIGAFFCFIVWSCINVFICIK